MRICLLTTQDLDADPFPEDDWPCDPRPFLPEAEWELVVLDDRTVERVSGLAEDGYDLFFNLCDGAADENRPGIEVVETLEHLGVPFTGATSNAPPSSCISPFLSSTSAATPASV
jgi:D-alanine-D-alanine ligase